MRIFFTGCTHFSHASIIKLASRPFSSVEEMDETLIQNWNSTVGRNDAVYHLGDFAWDRGRRWQNALNGNISLLQGNHDPVNWGVNYLEVKGFGPKLVLMHYPIEEWNGWWRGALHLHCHTHKPDLVSAPRRFNVGVDATGFKPISLEEIITHPNAEIGDV
jgi:calcineurin-like phosphoesterase family protein